MFRIISACVTAADGSEVACLVERTRLVEVARNVEVVRDVEGEGGKVEAKVETETRLESEIEIYEEDIVLDRNSPDEHWQALADFRRGGGEIVSAVPAYVIAAACYANEDGTAIVLSTQDQGDVLISARDRPELWAACEAWRDAGGTIAPYVAPQVAPRPLDPIEQLLVDKGLATAADIEQAHSRVKATRAGMRRE